MRRSSFHFGVRSAVVSVLALASTAVHATELASQDDVIVTATRVQQPIEQIIGAVTVITREEIEHRQPQSLQELLRNEPGMDVTNTGGLGKITTTFIRGTESEHALVLIDGIRAGSITAGFTALEFIPVDQIERIEIVRGPRSSLYGSDAIGGVIQIFTRKGGDRVTARVGGGTLHTFQANGGFYGQADDTSINLFAGRQSTQGFNACNGSGVLFQGCFTDEPDRDGFSSTSGSLRVVHDAGFTEVDLGALFAEGRTEYDGYYNATDFRQFAPHIKFTASPTENWQLALLAGSTNDDQDYLSDDEFGARYNTERVNVSLQSDVTLPMNQIVTVGVDFLDDNLESSLSFEKVSRDNGGVFGLYQIGIDTHRISLSARHDDNQQFGSHNTGNAGWKWQIVPGFYTMAGWGKAFRAPSFNDLYHPFGANPDLLPERSTSYELGVGGTITGLWTWSVNAYRTEIDDMIDLDPMFIPQNIAQAKIKGVEFETAATFGDTYITLNYSYVDPRNAAPGPNYDNILQRRARQSGKLSVTQQVEQLRLTGTFRAQGPRFNDAANTPSRELGGYGTIDFLAEYEVTDQWQLDAKLTNILDKQYSTVYWFNEPGFEMLASIRYRIK